MVSIIWYVVSWLTFKAEPGTRKGPGGRTPRGTLQLSGHAPEGTPGRRTPRGTLQLSGHAPEDTPGRRTPRGTLQLSGHAPEGTPGAISPNDAPTVDR